MPLKAMDIIWINWQLVNRFLWCFLWTRQDSAKILQNVAISRTGKPRANTSGRARTRTWDLQIISLALLPTELRARVKPCSEQCNYSSRSMYFKPPPILNLHFLRTDLYHKAYTQLCLHKRFWWIYNIFDGVFVSNPRSAYDNTFLCFPLHLGFV